MTANALDEFIDHIDYPVFIVTTASGGRRSGNLVGFTTPTRIKPARFLLLLLNESLTHEVAGGAERMAVHLLDDSHTELIELFGGSSGRDGDKFQHCDWHEGPDGIPIIDGCPNYFVGRILERIPIGDHTAYWLEAEQVEIGEGHEVRFQEVRHLREGKE